MYHDKPSNNHLLSNSKTKKPKYNLNVRPQDELDTSNSEMKKPPPKVANTLMPYWLKTKMEERKDPMDRNPFLTTQQN